MLARFVWWLAHVLEPQVPPRHPLDPPIKDWGLADDGDDD